MKKFLTFIFLMLFVCFNAHAADVDVDSDNDGLIDIAGLDVSANVASMLGAANLAAIKAYISLDDLVTLSGAADGATNLGTFTGSTIADSQTVKAAIQALETSVETKQATDTELSAIAGLTFTDYSIIQLTGAGAASVLQSGGNNYILGSNSDNSALEFKTPANTLSQIGAASATAVQQLCFTMNAPVAADDFLVWKAPAAMTITAINGVLLTGTNVVGGLDECDSDGANCVAVDSDITFNGGNDADDGSLSNGSIDANDWIMWHTTSVSAPGYITVCFKYTAP